MGRHPETKANRQPNDLLRDARRALPSRWDPRHPMGRAEFAEGINDALIRLYPDQAANKKSRIATFFVNPYWVGVMERGDRRSTSNERRAAVREVTGKTHDYELGLYPPRPRDTDTPPTNLTLPHTTELEPPSQAIRTHDGVSIVGELASAGPSVAAVPVGPTPRRAARSGRTIGSATPDEVLRVEGAGTAARSAETYVAFRPAALDGPARDWLRNEIPLSRSAGSDFRPVLAGQVGKVESRLSDLRDLDHQVGAGASRSQVSEFLAGPVRSLVNRACDDPVVQDRVLRVAIGSRELAGYQAVDCGADGIAQRHYLHALALSSAGGDRAFGGKHSGDGASDAFDRRASNAV